MISVDNDLDHCFLEAEDMVSGSNVPQMKDRKPPTSKCLSCATISVENCSTRLLLSKLGQLEAKVDGLDGKVDDLDESLRDVQSIMQRVDLKMGYILFLQQKLQSTFENSLDMENSSWIRKTFEISLKVMHYAVKAGLDKTIGLGQAVLVWEDLKSNVFRLGGISDDDRRAVLKGGESKELQEAWLRIQQTLAR
ncbi:hypothetical protein AXG93_1104s1000 [Marchantia polymorpha subsp. ruderalis]|uniref:Uncharacterized protein n=1 Tax=Marchantia polymorpha subsp. ruderalis TaxID=1480154 RepID=A0A176WN79_MARPO|nr:hypothetical protein AXG93_1104s1000 [Marchantia polymorpha subsp. ruderalis]